MLQWLMPLNIQSANMIKVKWWRILKHKRYNPILLYLESLQISE